jgi:hypothetical protein
VVGSVVTGSDMRDHPPCGWDWSAVRPQPVE